MVNDIATGTLLGQDAEVTGSPEHATDGRLAQVHHASITPAGPIIDTPSRSPIDVDELLASAPGPDPGGITDLTDEEADGFLKAIGLLRRSMA